MASQSLGGMLKITGPIKGEKYNGRGEFYCNLARMFLSGRDYYNEVERLRALMPFDGG